MVVVVVVVTYCHSGGWWRWALVSPGGVAPSPMVVFWCVCLC